MSLKVNQIACLAYLGNNLYGEVIQLITDRQLCWFRPLCLIIPKCLADSQKQDEVMRSLDTEVEEQISWRSELKNAISVSKNTDEYQVIDLQSGSDLLLPDSLFRAALDTEIIHLLPYLSENSHPGSIEKSNQRCLNKFVRLVWQAHKDKF